MEQACEQLLELHEACGADVAQNSCFTFAAVAAPTLDDDVLL
jgi:hypothetical protein